jgi:hypothetical protein
MKINGKKKMKKNEGFLPGKFFQKVKNGQKKCPKLKSRNTFVKIYVL